jgi:integrase
MRPYIILDERTMTTTGEDAGRYHIKIKVKIPVYKGDKKVWIPRAAKTGIYATPAEFGAMPTSRSKAWQDKQDFVDEKLKKARTICKINGLTPDAYITLMDGKGNFESVTGLFDWYISECLKPDPHTGEARDGNAIALGNAKNFFVRYKGSNHISYAEINKQWLEDCRAWALSEKKDEKGNVIKTPIALASFYMYCRSLRTIMNLARDPFGKITIESIPFGKGKGKFKIPSSSKKKRKIKLELSTEKLTEQKNKILSYVSKHPAQNRYLNYWKASFFGNGANMADVLRWKIKDYNKESRIIGFERKKTINTEEENEIIDILVGDELQDIINIEGNKTLDPDEYIFPILRKGMTSAERHATVKEFIILMNRSLKRVAKDLALEISLSSGSARYLMSTILDRAGMPKSVIKDLLGHDSEDTQSHYVSPYMVELRQNVLKLLRVG